MPDTIDEKTEQIEFFGKEFKLNEITNPHLRKLLTEGREKGYNDHSRWSCYSDSDYSNGPYEDYREKYHQYGDWNRVR